MPLTPFHAGPALLLGGLLHRRLDLPTLLVASVVIDVRAALVVLGPLSGPTHGVFTTFAGATGVAVAVAAVAYGLPGTARRVVDSARLADTDRAPALFLAAAVGTYSHVLLDATLYTDVKPFYPLGGNPFLLGTDAVPLVYGGCALAGIVALPLVAIRWTGHHAE